MAVDGVGEGVRGGGDEGDTVERCGLARVLRVLCCMIARGEMQLTLKGLCVCVCVCVCVLMSVLYGCEGRDAVDLKRFVYVYIYFP
jgi:hypothetical protein